jgi:hypothetical protein
MQNGILGHIYKRLNFFTFLCAVCLQSLQEVLVGERFFLTNFKFQDWYKKGKIPHWFPIRLKNSKNLT